MARKIIASNQASRVFSLPIHRARFVWFYFISPYLPHWASNIHTFYRNIVSISWIREYFGILCEKTKIGSNWSKFWVNFFPSFALINENYPKSALHHLTGGIEFKVLVAKKVAESFVLVLLFQFPLWISGARTTQTTPDPRQYKTFFISISVFGHLTCYLTVTTHINRNAFPFAMKNRWQCGTITTGSQINTIYLATCKYWIPFIFYRRRRRWHSQ